MAINQWAAALVLTVLSLGAKYALSKRTTLYGIYRNLRASDMYKVGVNSARREVANK